MDEAEPQFLQVGGRRIAYRRGGGDPDKVKLLWLPGFLSDMASTKAVAVAEWAAAHGHQMVRFDYSGHGLSSGNFLELAIGDWLKEASAMFDSLGKGARLVIGSSMGGWIALLLARRLAEQARSSELAGLVLIAPAWDMTDILMWRKFSQARQKEVVEEGVTYAPSGYGDPYPISKRLIEEGRSHLIAKTRFDPGCPVRILQGYRDPDVPWQHAFALLDILTGEDLAFTLIKNGDHRLSEPADLCRLIETVASLADRSD